MVSILGVWNGGGVCCCRPAQCSGVARALLVPLQCWRVPLSCRAVFLARCCGVWVVDVCLCCSCGGVSSVYSPLVVMVGGGVVDGGVPSWMVGGMVSEGRQCYWLPVECRCPPSVCWRPPCRLPCGPVEWRVWWVVCCPVFGLCCSPSHCPFPSYRSCSSSVLCCRVCCGWGSAVEGLCPVFLFSFPPFVFSVTALLV